MKTKATVTPILLAFTLCGFTFALAFLVKQSDFLEIISLYTGFFVTYSCIFKGIDATENRVNTLHFWVFVGIFLRFMVIFSFPNLSNDVYRFIWDGALINAGIHPFEFTPTQLIENSTIPFPPLLRDVYPHLNSPDYFSVYPPVCQAVFTGATWLFPTNMYASAVAMKLFLFACEVGSIFLLKELLPEHLKKNVLIYALNPLIIIEFCGNLHFEAAMIFGLLLCLYFIPKSETKNPKWLLPAFALVFSIISKLLTLLFLPFFLRYLGWKRGILFCGVVVLGVVICFVPMLDAVFIENFSKSLNLYFRQFEFNSSIYYLTKQIVLATLDYNATLRIGGFFAILVLIFVLFLTIHTKKIDFYRLCELFLWANCLYLLVASTVHPWYLAMPLVLSCFTQWRFMVVWSAMVVLSYSRYYFSSEMAHIACVGVEYVVVFGILLLEKRRNRDITHS
jgi:alpha-1,6-mannosyltransferase